MKKIVLILTLFFFSLGISGCMTLPLSRQENGTRPFNIKVTSDPSDASIYLDDILVGRTPAESLSVGIPEVCTLSFMPIRYEPQGQHYLRVSKEGYRDAVEPIEFEVVACPGVSYFYKMKKGEYHFILSKGEKASVSGADEILKYKKLLDEGAITKEDFEQKKKQLLGI